MGRIGRPRTIEASVSAECAVSAYGEMESEEIKTGGPAQQMRGLLGDRGIGTSALTVQFDEPLDPTRISRDILNAAGQGEYGTVVVGRHAFSGLQRFFRHRVGEELVLAPGEGVSVWVVE